MDKFTLKHEWTDDRMPEFNFANTTEFTCENLDTALERIEDFLRGAGFVFDGTLEIVRDEKTSN